MRHFADWKINPLTTQATQQKDLSSVKLHRQQTLRFIVLPVLIVAIVLVLLIVAILIPASPVYMGEGGHGLSIIADLFLTCFGLLPMLLCCGVVYVGLFAGVFGMNKAHRMSSGGLRRTQQFSRDVADKTAAFGDDLSQKSIKLNARFAMLDPILRIFAPLDRDPEEKEGGNDVNLEQ